jgi:ubiquinone/menaquinone biosynthesis C-methylase UbiE
MKRELLEVYVCPVSRSRLGISGAGSAESDEIIEGELVSGAGAHYKVRRGVPIFLPLSSLSETEQETRAEYDAAAEQKYDAAVDWLFQSFYEDENDVREQMIDLLHLTPAAKVLEIGSGTGRDSFRIARKLGKRGEFFVQDLSEQMVVKTRERLEAETEKLGLSAKIDYFVSTARFLPFPDGFFDAVFHFGGFNNFSEPKKTLAEMTRIVKQGGRVVFGDESLIDLPHKGWRGGTIRTRYYGLLEGVTPEARKMAIEAAKAKGVSVHEWLDSLVREAARSHRAAAGDHA